MRNVCLRALVLTLVLTGMGWIIPTASGQTRQQIFNFNASWRYYQAGDLPAANWMATAYNDAAWGTGTGNFGFDAGESLTYGGVTYGTMATALNRYIPNSTTVQVATYYFRGRFNYAGTTSGVQLILTNILDDGAVIYLNGTEVARVSMPTGPVAYATQATARPAASGGDEFSGHGPDVITISPNNLVQGQNVIAVELHQVGTASSDAVFGMSLTSVLPSGLAITAHPQSVQATAGDTVTFSVTATGAPIYYQWRKDGVNIPNATSNSYTIATVNTTHAGNYSVRVTNSVTTDLVSSNALLTVFQDTEGPVLLSAVVQDNVPLTNRIDITLDEAPSVGSANTNNIRLVRAGTSGATAVYVPITSTLVSARTIRLNNVGPLNWTVGGDYYIIVNGLTDARGNQIAPNSVIPVSWQIRTKMAQISDSWSFYDSWFLDATFPDIYRNGAWFKTNYVEDPLLWAGGNGTFYRTTSDPAIYLCAGDPVATQLTISSYPVLFRRNFTLAPGYGSTGKLQFRHVVDDGLVLYLNGTEIYRWNMPSPVGGPLDENTKASMTLANSTAALCITAQELTVTNLLPGRNWLGAAVYQANDAEADVVFGLEIDAVFNRSSTLGITNGLPGNLRLAVSNAGPNIKITWPNAAPNLYYGYILKETSSLDPQSGPSASASLWLSVSNATNGALIPHNQPKKFYELFKGPNSP